MILLFVPATEVSYFDLLMKGGWLMYPLFLLSIISVYIFVNRYYYLISQKRADSAFFEMLKNLIKGGEIDNALALCASTDSSESRILTKGIQNLGKPIRDIHEQMEMEGKQRSAWHCTL